MNKKLIKIISAGFASLIILSAGITAIINTVAKPDTPDQQLDQSYNQGQTYDRAQISGTDNFATTLFTVTKPGGKPIDMTDQYKDDRIRITVANNQLFSTVNYGGQMRDGDVVGRWVSSRSMTYNGEQFLIDTYKNETVGNGFGMKEVYVVVLNQTTGTLTVRQSGEVDNGNTYVTEYIAVK